VRGLTTQVLNIALATAAPLTLSACSAPTSYMGIGLAPGTAPEALQSLAVQARIGDKQAQLELGKAYEAGEGVAQDPKRALRLYAMAAATTGGTIWVYQPPVKKGGRGSTIPVNTGPIRQGLPEAKEHYTALKARVAAERREAEPKR
jgi:hypothetical protein